MTVATLAKRLDHVSAVLAGRPAPAQSRLTAADMSLIPVQDREFLAGVAERCSVGANGQPDLDALTDVELDRLAGIAEFFKAIIAGRTGGSDGLNQPTGTGGVPISNQERISK